MKKLLLVSTLLLSSTAYAHQSCEVDINGGINVKQDEILFSKNKSTRYRISKDENLYIGGRQVDLNSEQQALVINYSHKIRATVPEVRELALNAVDLAMDGVSLAFNELLGEGNNVTTTLTEELSTVRDEVENHFDSESGFYVGEDGFSESNSFDKEFENKIESAVEGAIESSMGSLLMAVGKEMMLSGGDMEAFETRMEGFGERIEAEMEARGEHIEQQAEQLCQTVLEINELEDELIQQVDGLAGVNIFKVSH